MLNHLNINPTRPRRVVILGAKGFVGRVTAQKLTEEKIDYLALGREELDLTHSDSAHQLANILQPEDVLIIVSAKAPCKNNAMLLENIQMMKTICDALSLQSPQHVIYISSDAVYTDSMQKLQENSPAAPASLHGVMHLTREHMLQSVLQQKSLLILRPSLLYGAKDPHNGYGPNSFYRLAIQNKAIELFGYGEELRDHVYIEDVGKIIHLCLMHRSYGVLNITTGEVVSFADIAELVKQSFNQSLKINYRPRSGVMPHNGYRAFDNSVCKHAFSSFQYTMLLEGLLKMHQQSENCFSLNTSIIE